eukprot:jgi/Phyca11/537357/estExt2_fgenesh1_pg.C_PHYCAscaffold_850015
MVNVVSVFTVALAAVAAVASGASMRSEAAPMPTGSWPASKGTVYLKEPYTVKKGQTFDGGMKTYARSNVKCGGQKESGWQTAVFMVEPGATLKNVIIGKDQMEGVHCEQSGCTIQNVWWEDATIENIKIKGKKVDVCAWSQGSTSGEPGKLGAGPSGSLCQYSTSTISYA